MGLSPSQQAALQQILKSADPLVQAQQAAKTQVPRVSTPGIVGGAPPSLIGQPAGVQPKGVAGLPASGGAAATTGTAPPPRTAVASPEFTPIPLPVPAGPTTAGGATVYGAVQNITSVLNANKKREADKLMTRAEVLTRSLQDAIDRRDEKAIDEILTPANKAILKKAGIGEPPEIRETTPEEKGVMNGIKHKIVTTQTAGEQAKAVAEQNALLSQQAAQEKLQKDKDLAASQALGTTMSSAEIKQAERIAGGLEPSATVMAQMSAGEQKQRQDMLLSYAKLDQDFDIAQQQIKSDITIKKLDIQGRHEDAEALRALEGKRYQLQADYNKERLAAQAATQNAKNKSGLTAANKMLLESSQRNIDSARDHLAALRNINSKNPTDELTSQIEQQQAAIKTQETDFNDLKEKIDAMSGMSAVFGDGSELQ